MSAMSMAGVAQVKHVLQDRAVSRDRTVAGHECFSPEAHALRLACRVLSSFTGICDYVSYLRVKYEADLLKSHHPLFAVKGVPCADY